MDPQTVFCPYSACPARGQIGRGNVGVHSQKDGKYMCHICDRTFRITKGTVFYRPRLPRDTIVKIITLLAYGCPRQAVVAAYGLDEQTVKSLEEGAGTHCQQVHGHLAEQPRDLGQVQADELRAKIQGYVLWMAMAVQVSTRLWLGGVLSASRDTDLIVALIQKVRSCALCRPLPFCVDGCRTYIGAIHSVFREPMHTGRPGLPHCRICLDQSC